MRGAAKSLLPLPTAYMGNVTKTTKLAAGWVMSQRQLRWQLESYPKTIPAIEAFFEFPSHSIENGHKRAKSNTSENGRFSP